MDPPTNNIEPQPSSPTSTLFFLSEALENQHQPWKAIYKL